MKKTWKKMAVAAMAAVMVTAAFSPSVETQAGVSSAGTSAQPVITAKNRTVEKVSAKTCKMKMAAGQKVNLTVKSGKKNVTKKAKYTVSSKKIMTVSKSGVVTAKKTGTAKVTVTYKGKRNVLTVKIARKKHTHKWKNVYDAMTAKTVWLPGCISCACGMTFYTGEEYSLHFANVSFQAAFGENALGPHHNFSSGSIRQTVISGGAFNHKECTVCGQWKIK